MDCHAVYWPCVHYCYYTIQIIARFGHNNDIAASRAKKVKSALDKPCQYITFTWGCKGQWSNECCVNRLTLLTCLSWYDWDTQWSWNICNGNYWEYQGPITSATMLQPFQVHGEFDRGYWSHDCREGLKQWGCWGKPITCSVPWTC